MIEKIKSLLIAADEERRKAELAAVLGDSVIAESLEEVAEVYEGQVLHLLRKGCGLIWAGMPTW